MGEDVNKQPVPPAAEQRPSVKAPGPALWIRSLTAVVLALAAFLIYFPTRTYEFLRMDDPDYVSLNTHVNTGLSLENIGWAFTHRHSGNWHPLTWISHMLDCQLFGLNPMGHHLVNAGFHALNSVLLLLLLYRLTKAFWESSLVAALFAFHPLHVESVAWVAERKDVLSAFFFFLTLFAYAAYVERSKRQISLVPKQRHAGSGLLASWSWIWYPAALVLFALGLMSKPMLVTTPFVLLLLDYWPLRRFEFKAQNSKLKTLGPLLLEKLPFFLLTIAASIVTLQVQANSGAVVSLENLSLGMRLGNAIWGYLRYLELMLVPAGLSVFYPLRRDIPSWEVVLAGLVLLSVTIFAVQQMRRRPYLFCGWFWYLGILVPVIGIVKAGEQAMADRYTYLPLIGAFMMLAWGLSEVAHRFPWWRKPVAVGALAVVAGCAVLTSHQLGYWKTSRSLYEHALKVTEKNYTAMTVLGGILWEEGKLPEAKAYLMEGLKIAPRSPDLNTGLGFVLIGEKDYRNAQYYFETALSITQDLSSAHYGLAFCLFQQNKFAEAEAACRRAWTVNPEEHKAGLLLAMSLASQSKNTEAASVYVEALRRKPGWAPALRGMAALALAAGKPADAATLYERAVQAEPGDLEGHNGLATALAGQGKLESAAAEYAESLRIDPGQAAIHSSLAELLSRLNKPAAAIQQYRDALQLQPDSPAALNNLAWILATHPDPKIRDGAEAVTLAEKACLQSRDQVPFFVGTLAAAYAETGRFADAIATAEKARDLAATAGLKEVADTNSKLLELYRAGRPYHDPGPVP